MSSKNVQRWEAGIRLFLFLISVFFAVLLLSSDAMRVFLAGIGSVGYIGAFFAGAFFTTGLTILPAFAILAVLAESLNPWLLALIAGLGAALMDVVLIAIVQKHAVQHVRVFAPRLFHKVRKLHRHKSPVRHLLPVLGGILLAMPGLPDEVALTFMSAGQVQPKKFFIYAFLSKFTAVLVLALGVNAWKLF
ncbi:hypothetical protein HY493_00880 [Candidatus Woesearchaeota archaeon]|nr:hypothetical protein [Candidatus Woesearchaeota archaeon]